MTEEKTPKLLTICIPTYNRAAYLDTCLEYFLEKQPAQSPFVELIISDNCSDDETPAVVDRYRAKGFSFQYIRNETNIGADANIVQCLEYASGEYFWIFGDDDLLTDNKLDIILQTLQAGIYGMVYLGNYWFREDHIKELPALLLPQNPVIYRDKHAFLKRVNIWATFISAGIFRKAVLEKLDIRASVGSNLNQLNWVLSSIFSAHDCLYYEGYFVACKAANTGGYSLFTTFGKNLNDIVDTLQAKGLVPAFAKKLLNFYIIRDFMPLYCIQYKQKKLTGFKSDESPFPMLKHYYKQYFIYWVTLFPLQILPVAVGKKYYYGLKKLKII